MLKRTVICIALIVSSFVSPAFASGGVEYTEEDEAKAFASRFTISGAEYGTATEARGMLDARHRRREGRCGHSHCGV